MTVLFDYQAFEMQPFGGVSHSYAELIAHLRDAGCGCRVGLKESDNVYIRDEGIRPLHYTHDRFLAGKKHFMGQRRLTRMAMRALGYHNDGLDVNLEYCIRLLKRRRFDIFEPTYFNPYFLPYLDGKPFVLTVHDMIPELLGVDDQQAAWKRQLCPLATHIHVPSENTKKDLVEVLGIAPEKVSVIPHGAPATPATRYPSPYPYPYLLYVGARWSYKNFGPFAEECALAIARCRDLRVVCTGAPFSEEELRMLANLQLTDRFIHHHATERELQTLYQNAMAFVYPSAYEGFGLPILEAFTCGCPVMLNNASCFPEVGGEAAVYFDMGRHGDLAEHILALVNATEGERGSLVARGYERSKHFSWERSAEKLHCIYKNILA